MDTLAASDVNHVGTAPRWLVFVSAGDHPRLHRSLGRCREFDLLVAFYGDDAHIRADLTKRGADVRDIRGGKFPNLWALWRDDPALLSEYDAVLVLDDDLRLSRNQIVTMFRRREELQLTVVGPTFRPTGVVSWESNRTQWRSAVRRTNVVEVNAPLFERSALELFFEEFDGSLVGYGIEAWYTHVFSDMGASYAVLDEVAIVNPRRRAHGKREINLLQKYPERVARWERVSEARGIPFLDPSTSDWLQRSLTRALVAGTRAFFDSTLVFVSREWKLASRRWNKARRLLRSAVGGVRDSPP